MVAVLGAGLSFVSTSSSFVGGKAHSQAVYIFHGWGAEVCGQLSSYMCGGSCGSLMCGVATVSSWYRDGVSSYAAPTSGCEEGMEKGG